MGMFASADRGYGLSKEVSGGDFASMVTAFRALTRGRPRHDRQRAPAG